MKYHRSDITLYACLVIILCVSFGFNVHLYNRIESLENSRHFWRCGTTENEFSKIQQEIKRLENSPFLHIQIGEPKSVLKK